MIQNNSALIKFYDGNSLQYCHYHIFILFYFMLFVSDLGTNSDGTRMHEPLWAAIEANDTKKATKFLQLNEI